MVVAHVPVRPHGWLRSTVAQQVRPDGVRVTIVGLPTPLVGPHYQRQLGQEWCVYACVAMVMSYFGVTIPQSRLARAVHGRPIDKGATTTQILGLLTSCFADLDVCIDGLSDPLIFAVDDAVQPIEIA